MFGIVTDPAGGRDRLEARPGERPRVRAPLPPSDRDHIPAELGLVVVVMPVGEACVQGAEQLEELLLVPGARRGDKCQVIGDRRGDLVDIVGLEALDV